MMDATGTPDAVETPQNPTDTTVTTDGPESPPVTRPEPGISTRAYDAFAGIVCVVTGGYLLGRAFGVIDYPEVPTWLSP